MGKKEQSLLLLDVNFMFDTPFEYKKFNFQKRTIGQLSYIEHIYKFRGTSNKRYIVFAEQYDYSVYAIKFCTHERKNYTDRFNVLSRYNECNRVLTTVGFIMQDIVKGNPFASFIFIGSHLPGEEESNTKRFRLYTNIVEQLVSPILFEQRKSVNKSACLMLNRDNQETDLLNKIDKMFREFHGE